MMSAWPSKDEMRAARKTVRFEVLRRETLAPTAAMQNALGIPCHGRNRADRAVALPGRRAVRPRTAHFASGAGGGDHPDHAGILGDHHPVARRGSNVGAHQQHGALHGRRGRGSPGCWACALARRCCRPSTSTTPPLARHCCTGWCGFAGTGCNSPWNPTSTCRRSRLLDAPRRHRQCKDIRIIAGGGAGMKPSQFEYHGARHGRRSGRHAGAIRARRRPSAGRWPDFGGGDGDASGAPRPSDRHQRRGRAGQADGLRRPADDRRLRAPRGVGRRPAPGPLGRLLGLVQHHIAHPPIRARGTFCGSLANADAASEWCLLAVALDAQIELRSARGSRTMARRRLPAGLYVHGDRADEMITAASLPLLPDDTRVGFYEICPSRRRFRPGDGAGDHRPGPVRGGRQLGIPPAPAARQPKLRWPPAPVSPKRPTRLPPRSNLPEEDPYLRALAATAVLRALTEAR